MYCISKCSLFATLILFAGTKSFSQFKSNGLEIGVQAGTLIYQGDLSEGALGSYKSLHPAVGIYVSKSLDNYFAVRATLTRGKLSADESTIADPEWRQQRNFSFKTPVTEFYGSLVWQPFGKNNEENTRRLSPYLFAGAGISFLRIQRDWSRLNTNYFDAKSEVVTGMGYDTMHATPRVLPIVPVGAGVQYVISPRLALNLEGTYRFTTSDYLDGFKFSANANRKDNYYGVSLGLSFSLGTNRYDCPKAW
jgi:hypothetical protein